MTIKHLNYESKHGLLCVPAYSSNPDALTMDSIPTEHFFGINSAVDHKSETQLHSWKDLISCMYTTYNASPLGCHKPYDMWNFSRLVTGMNTDHAEDQKKLVRLFKEWKGSCEREMRGEEAILSASLADLIPLCWEETEKNIASAGGRDGWDARERAGTVSQGGAVKLTSLAGAVFSNKDKKKGQQDSLQVYLEETIGYMVRFLDTSNTHYQCHCDAAVELIIQLVFYWHFLELVQDLKDKRTFTNIEKTYTTPYMTYQHSRNFVFSSCTCRQYLTHTCILFMGLMCRKPTFLI